MATVRGPQFEEQCNRTPHADLQKKREQDSLLVLTMNSALTGGGEAETDEIWYKTFIHKNSRENQTLCQTCQFVLSKYGDGNSSAGENQDINISGQSQSIRPLQNPRPGGLRGSWEPSNVQNSKICCGLYVQLFWPKAVFWIPVLKSGGNAANNYGRRRRLSSRGRGEALPLIYANGFWGSKAKGRDFLGDPRADLMPIVKRIPNRMWMFTVKSIHAWQDPTTGYLDTLMTLRRGTRFLHQLGKYQVLNGEGVSYLGVAI